METAQKQPSTEHSVKKVLVVEDDARIRQAVTSILEKNGYLVLQAADGEDGFNQSEKADIILLDMFLPKLPGDQFMKKVRDSGNYVPVVVMSASISKGEAIKSFEDYGIIDFVAKPFQAADIVEKVKHAGTVADNMRFLRKATDRIKGFIERQTLAPI